MKKKYNFYNLSKRQYTFLFALLLISTILFGCFKLKSLTHPSTAETNSYFDVTFVCEPNTNTKTEGKGFFGALIPKGWRVQDYTDYTVFFPNASENIYGRLCYDQYYTAQLAATLGTPDGYYWWGGRSIDDLELMHSDNNKCDNFAFTFRIYTNDKTGTFNLRYVVGTNGNGENPVGDGKYIDEQRSITITAGNKLPMKKTANWELLSPESGDQSEVWDQNAKFYADKDYDGFFTRWYGWTGGDIGRSAPLGDGRSIWVWGDSHTGAVSSNRTRLQVQNQFERNFVIEQSGEDFSAFRLINEGTPGSIKEVVVPTDDNGNKLDKHAEWYWPAGSTVYYRNGVPELQMVLSRVKNDGSGGMWGMEGVSADVAIFSLPDLKLKEIKKYKNRAVHLTVGNDRFGLDYAGYVFKDDDGIVYIYGAGDIAGICTRYGFVARVVNGDLTGEWEYYNAKTKEWSTDTSWQNSYDNWETAAVAPDPAFVFKDGGKYFGIAQPGRCFSRSITLYEADSPYGPFHNPKVIGVLPSAISSKDSYFCSLLAIHPQYSKNGEIFFSVSKNYQNESIPWYGQPGTADTYLPYFFRVKNWRDKLNISDMDITDNKGDLTAQYEDGLANLTDNSESTVYSASASTAWIQYVSPSSARLNRYTITSAADSPEKDPSHWKVLGSNDGITWTVLDERHYIEFDDRLQTVNYDVPITQTMYTHFRLDVLATKGGAGLQVAEWQMFGEFEYQKGTAAELETVTVNGENIPIQDVMIVNVLPTDNPKINIALSTKDYGTLVGVDSNISETMDKPGIKKHTIKVISEDGVNEKEYELVLNRWFSFDDIVNVKWNNTLMLYLNKLEEYSISGYQWYKNDNTIQGATSRAYSVGPKKTDLLDANATYHVAMSTRDGVLRSDAKKVSLKSMTVQAYPNPVKSGEALTLVADIDDELLTGSLVEVYNIQGNKINTVNVRDRATTINMPASVGVYMLKFKTKTDFEENMKVVVK